MGRNGQPGTRVLTAPWEKAVAAICATRGDQRTPYSVMADAGVNMGTIYWHQRRPDLRLSVIVALAKEMKVAPPTLVREILKFTNGEAA